MSKKVSVNKGIQAKKVKADVLAVGDHAKAIKNVTTISKVEINKAISELSHAVKDLNLDEHAHNVVKEDIDQLYEVTQKEQVDKEEVNGLLKSIAGKLKMVGVVLTETTTLIEPIKKIASAVGTALTFLGV